MIARSCILFCLVLVALIKCQKKSTNVTSTLRALRPSGLRAYIYANKDDRTHVFFYAQLLRNVDDVNELKKWGPAKKQAHGGWLYEDLTQVVPVGMVIRYRIFVFNYDSHYDPYKDILRVPIRPANGDNQLSIYDMTNENNYIPVSLVLHGSMTDMNTFTVTSLEDRLAPDPNCLATITKVRGRRVCAGEVIFEDNFDTFREDLWQIEQYIPVDHPEHPFVSYQRLTSDPIVFVENGNLHIIPKLQKDLFRGINESILYGSLDLTDGCTRSKCSKVAFGSDILPPIVSGRVTSIFFAFTYGTVYVRAKIPQGDWLYPEILLEPLLKKYDDRYNRDIYGILKVAMAGGNQEIIEDTYGNKVLRGRPILDENCEIDSQSFRLAKHQDLLGDDFHEYSLLWTPDEIKLYIDGTLYIHYSVTDLERTYRCLEEVRSDFHPSLQDYLQLTLGVAAGGVTEFPDSVRNGAGQAKPWRNGDPKASLKFWQNRQSWLPTWTQPGLVVDYVKVVAL